MAEIDDDLIVMAIIWLLFFCVQPLAAIMILGLLWLFNKFG